MIHAVHLLEVVKGVRKSVLCLWFVYVCMTCCFFFFLLCGLLSAKDLEGSNTLKPPVV